MELSQRMPDGATLREHLVAAAKAGQADERLEAEVPAAGAALWAVFADLSSARPAGMGASAIPPSEILAWCTLHRCELTVWEVETLQAMDRAALATHARLQAAKTKH